MNLLLFLFVIVNETLYECLFSNKRYMMFENYEL